MRSKGLEIKAGQSGGPEGTRAGRAPGGHNPGPLGLRGRQTLAQVPDRVNGHGLGPRAGQDRSPDVHSLCGRLGSCPSPTHPPKGQESRRSPCKPTLTKASRTSSACSLLSGVDTVSPRVMRVRLVRQFIRSGGFTWWGNIQVRTQPPTRWSLPRTPTTPRTPPSRFPDRPHVDCPSLRTPVPMAL